MRFYEVGRYTFELTVARNGVTSAPAEIEVIVDDPSSSAALAENNGGDGSSAISRRSELQPGKNTANMALASQNAPKNEMRVVQPAPLPPVPTPIAPVANRSEKTPNLPSKGILLDEIRREEADYYAKRGGRVVSVSTNPPPDLGEPPHADKAPSVVQTTDKPLSPAGQNAPPVPIKPALDKGTEVSIGRKIDLDGIRSEEEQFNRSRPIQKLPPEITPIQKGPDAAPGNNVKPPEVPDVRIDVPKPSASADDALKAKMKALEEAKFAALKKERDDLAKAEAERVETQKKQQAELARMEAQRREKEQAEKAAALKQQLAETAKAEAAKVEAAKKQREDAEREAALKQKQAEEAARIAALKPTEIVKAPSPASLPPAAANTGAGLDQGLQLIKAGQYSAAVNALKPLAQANPKDVPTQMALGIALFEGAEKPDSYDRAGTQAALSVFNDIVQSNEQNAQAFMYAGHCNGRLDHDQEKMQYFRKGISLAKAKVGWEIRWYMGNRNLKEKDFANAASLLLEAEAALLPGTKEPRLLRDLAYAFHGAKQDDEAIKRVNALWELGYTPDANLVAELKKVSPNAVKVPDNAVAQNAPAIPAVADTRLDVPTPGGRDTTNTPIDRSRIVATAPALPAIPDVPNPAQTAQNKLPLPTENAIKSAPQVAVPNTPAAVTPGAKSIEPRKQSTVSDLDNMTPSTIPTTERTRKNSTSRDVLKERPKKELPRVPESFEAALDTGKRALANGHRVMLKIEEEAKKGDDDSKLRIEALRNEASDAWDEAEAMLRGAWEMKPDDLGVKAQFEELAKQVGVVALVKSPLLISKPNGLVVLNAEPSIVYPEGKTMYYAWQQVDGKELSLRREDLDKKTVGLRIKIPGTYKFELVVSDGSRGGNPVSVIVEVR